MTGTQTQSTTKTKIKIPTPKRYKIVIHNDNVTPMEFVVLVLKTIFGYDQDRASSLMMQVHETGSGVVGEYPFEIAEQKVYEATVMIKTANQTLRLTVEE